MINPRPTAAFSGAVIATLSVISAQPAAADTDKRTIVVRERASASLINDAFSFKVLKLRGYSIDIRISGEKRTLKLGEDFGPANAACTVKFEEISPETRIARFKTDCP